MDPNGRKTDSKRRTEVEWVEGIIPYFKISKMQKNVDNAKKQENVDNAKRNGSADNSAINPPKRKRAVPRSNRSFAEVAKGKMILGIVDHSDPDSKIPRSKWQWVDVALCNAFLDVLKEMPGPLQSVLMLGCSRGLLN